MVWLKCKRCGNEWEYKGKSEWYAPCSRCKTSINIKKQIGKNKQEEKKKEEKGDVIKSEISERREYLTTCKQKDTPTLKLSNVRGI